MGSFIYLLSDHHLSLSFPIGFPSPFPPSSTATTGLETAPRNRIYPLQLIRRKFAELDVIALVAVVVCCCLPYLLYLLYCVMTNWKLTGVNKLSSFSMMTVDTTSLCQAERQFNHMPVLQATTSTSSFAAMVMFEPGLYWTLPQHIF